MKLFVFAVVLALGCNQSGSTPPTTTETKPAAAATQPPVLPPGHPDVSGQKPALPAGHPDISMDAQQLPHGAAAGDATNPKWVVPQDWKPSKQSSVRRASFVVTGADNQAAEISVTVFPGDVGGLLANVNRWRGQIELEPITGEQVADLTKKLDVNGVAATVVDFANDATGKQMVVATISRDGNSWFFKMTGDKPVIEAQKAAFLGFVKSAKF